MSFWPKNSPHGLKQPSQLVRPGRYHFTEGVLGLHAPAPSVLEGGNLGRRLLAALLPEQHVVRCVGVERRVEIDQVDALVIHLTEDVEVVAEIEPVLPVWACHLEPMRISPLRDGEGDHQPTSSASTLRSTLPFSAPEMGQPSLAASAALAKALASMPGTSPLTARALDATFQPPSIC